MEQPTVEEVKKRMLDEAINEQVRYLAEMCRKALNAETLILIPRIDYDDGVLTLLTMCGDDEMRENEAKARAVHLLLKHAKTLLTGAELELQLLDKKTGKTIPIPDAEISGEFTL